MNGYHLHRDPVLDEKKRLFGYEVTFRRAGTLAASAVDADMLAAMAGNGEFTALCGSARSFLDIDPAVFAPDILRPLPEKVIPLIQERDGLDKDVFLNACAVKKEGRDICIAFTPPGRGPLPLHQAAGFVCLDVRSVPPEELEALAAPFRCLRLKLRATGVHDRKTFDRCQKCGFSLYQGIFFIEPSTGGAASISSSQALLIQLSNDLRANKEVHQIEKAFRNSPKLTYGLLNLINSAFFGVGQKVSSIPQAIMLLGYETLQKWVILLLFTIDHGDDRSNPLVEKALVRSRVMEILARKAGQGETAESAFITGMLSLVNVLFQVTPEQIAEGMNLAAEIKEALLARTGFLGALLKTAEWMDLQEYEAMEEILAPLQLCVEDVLSAETAAIMESQGILAEQQPNGRQ
jgi:EAL and modified HD-GYP domain-containing signal transduction protein